jgi:hypothetical protein
MVLLFNVLLFARRKRKRNINVLMSVLSVSLLFLIWMGIDPVLKELATLSDPRAASLGRLTIWKDTIALSKDFPIMGIGLGNFQHLYPKYRTIEANSLFVHAESDYVETLSDTGVLGTFLLFGGFVFFLSVMMKKWFARRDPFVKGITLGGIIGAVALLFHGVAEFNLHIPANALLFFLLLGLIAAAVHLEIREKKESSRLPVRTFALGPKTKLVLYPLIVILLLTFATIIVRTCIASFYFQSYKESRVASRQSPVTTSDSQTPTNDSRVESRNPRSKDSRLKTTDSRLKTLDSLLSALTLDPSNAVYHYELGHHYSEPFSESLKKGRWRLDKGKWAFKYPEETSEYGLLTLDSFSRALDLLPTNAWHHFYFGWTLHQLSALHASTQDPRLSPYASSIPNPHSAFRTPHSTDSAIQNPNSKIQIPASLSTLNPMNPRNSFLLALTLDPTNPHIKEYVEKTTSLESPVPSP